MHTRQVLATTVDVRCTFTTSRAFNPRKDILPSDQLSNLIYKFQHRVCDSQYVGRTAQRLSLRIRQPVPLHLLPPAARAERPTCGGPRLARKEGDPLAVQMSARTDSAVDVTVSLVAATPKTTATAEAAKAEAGPTPATTEALPVAKAGEVMVTVMAPTKAVDGACHDTSEQTNPASSEKRP